MTFQCSSTSIFNPNPTETHLILKNGHTHPGHQHHPQRDEQTELPQTPESSLGPYPRVSKTLPTSKDTATKKSPRKV